MAYDIFHGYGLDKIRDSMTENFDSKDNNATQWKFVKSKEVMDSDGFMTEYCWYTNGDKHIFMFGDSDIYEPDEDYADWVTDSDKEASDWFDDYSGFSDNTYDWDSFDEEDNNDPQGNADFMNEGFNRLYGNGLDLED